MDCEVSLHLEACCCSGHIELERDFVDEVDLFCLALRVIMLFFFKACFEMAYAPLLFLMSFIQYVFLLIAFLIICYVPLIVLLRNIHKFYLVYILWYFYDCRKD